eukprot:1162117-Pelagomonas_calceolata.AAC.6
MRAALVALASPHVQCELSVPAILSTFVQVALLACTSPNVALCCLHGSATKMVMCCDVAAVQHFAG